VKNDNPVLLSYRPLLGLLFAAFAVYCQVVTFDFIYFDDAVYTTSNDYIKEGLSIKALRWAITSFDFNWHPLTWASLMLDSSIYGGLEPGGFHLTSLLIHLINIALVHRLFLQLGISSSLAFFAAGCFALHPLNSSPVCWISARKDLLATFFGIPSVIFYVRFLRSKSRLEYLVSILLGSASLMCKGTFISLPAMLILIDFYLLSRRSLEDPTTTLMQMFVKDRREIVLTKLPFVAICALFIFINIIAQDKVGAIVPSEALPVWKRLFLCLGYYWDYLIKCFYPGRTAILYPENYALNIPKITCGVVLLLGASFLALKNASKVPEFAFGWFWFVLTLLPMIGIIKIGAHSIADRYTYIPYLGLFLLGGKTLELATISMTSRTLCGLQFTVLLLFSVLTYHEAGYWRDSELLFRRALSHTTKNHIVEFYLATFLAKQNREAEASEIYEKILREASGVDFLHRYLADSYFNSNRPDRALDHYKAALKLNPQDPSIHNRIAGLYYQLGNIKAAHDAVSRARSLDPSSPFIERNFNRIHNARTSND
jgi:tetratricopeptide (TPR) repeat protein